MIIKDIFRYKDIFIILNKLLYIKELPYTKMHVNLAFLMTRDKTINKTITNKQKKKYRTKIKHINKENQRKLKKYKTWNFNILHS